MSPDRSSRRRRRESQSQQITGAQHLTGRHEVADDADQQVRHVAASRKNACGVVDKGGESNCRANEPFYHPLSSELGASRGVIRAKSGVAACFGVALVERLHDVTCQQLAAAQRRVDALAGEWIEE